MSPSTPSSRRVVLLGATGSVGRSTCEVLREMRHGHRLVGLAARSRDDALTEIALEFGAEAVALVQEDAAARAARILEPRGVRVFSGVEAPAELVRSLHPDQVVAAMTGAAGLEPALEALRQGCDLLLANKETLVAAGDLVVRVARESDARILPVDSEHSAIHQALRGEDPSDVRRLYLTASGGPFVDLPRHRLERITPAEAVRHPTWSMGPKISVDSATMMNKALEIVEAHWLFGIDAERIDVLIHRQSIVHSMVEFVDGSLIAQLGVPSMTVPIRYALAYPRRAPTRQCYFQREAFATLTFEEPDEDRFPALRLGREVARTGGTAGAVFNAANEAAVEAFLAGRATFDRIVPVVEEVLKRHEPVPHPTLDDIRKADAWARREAARCLR